GPELDLRRLATRDRDRHERVARDDARVPERRESVGFRLHRLLDDPVDRAAPTRQADAHGPFLRRPKLYNRTATPGGRMNVTIAPITPHVGAEITGMRGKDLVDRRAAEDCLTILQKHGVVVYREVQIEDIDLVAFSRMLGEVAVVPTGEHEYPEIQTITLDP